MRQMWCMVPQVDDDGGVSTENRQHDCIVRNVQNKGTILKTTITINSTAIEQYPGVLGGALTVDGKRFATMLRQLAAGESIARIAIWHGADAEKLKTALRAMAKAVDNPVKERQ